MYFVIKSGLTSRDAIILLLFVGISVIGGYFLEKSIMKDVTREVTETIKQQIKKQ